MKNISEGKINNIIADTVASMSFEGMNPTQEDIERAKRVLRGETTAEGEIGKLVELYRVK